MITEIGHNGTQIAAAEPTTSSNALKDAIVPNTISDLLDLLQQRGTKGLPMLRTTFGVLSNFLSTNPKDLSLQAVFDAKELFRPYLTGRKYSENSVRTYVQLTKTLLNSAAELGWKPIEDVPQDWKPVMALAKKQKIKKNLVKYLTKLRPTPAEVTSQDVVRWSESKVEAGFSMPHISRTANWLWQTFHKLGVAGPDAKHSPSKYRAPVDQFPSRMKSEVIELLRWKQADFSPGRPSDGQHRPVTAKALRDVICRAYGYALSVRKETQIKCLADLVQEPIIAGFVEWRINERRNNGYAVRISLAMLKAALRHHPVHRNLDLSWCDRLLESVPLEPESVKRAKKAEKYLEYSVIEKIPQLIYQIRLKLKTSSDDISHLVMQELLMNWLRILPWRQRNIRECRVSGSDPNLFKSTIPPFSELTKPDWVLKEEQKNPSAQFWQFRFRSIETKTGIEIHSLLPKQLVPLLENYLSEHRPHLLRGNYCDNLFLNRRGGPMDSIAMSQIVRELTLRYAGRQITPHRFRDIIAYTWLKDHPEDFLRLSKLLWHRNVNTTIRIYGARFNESSGVCAMEAWLEDREKRSK
jgi:hypothetical protein